MLSMHARHVYAYRRDGFAYGMLGISILWPTRVLVAHLLGQDSVCIKRV